ncbi:MAG: YutD family protein [Bacilli bacterium]|nr:YutD family protein [Bacilli bacterium]
MKKYTINEKEYELIENYKDGFDFDEAQNRMTDFFDNYDYVIGDWAYGKLRLKGFCEKSNKHCNNINSYKNKEKYLKEECAYDCKYFVLKKI